MSDAGTSLWAFVALLLALVLLNHILDARLEATPDDSLAAHYAAVIIGCLNGEPIREGARIVFCDAHEVRTYKND